MRNAIPDEISSEIESMGGLNGILNGMPRRKELESMAYLYEILSDAVRLQILLALSHGRLCVCVIKSLTSCPDTRLSYHLNVLRKANLITSEREKSYIRYSLTEKGREISNGIIEKEGLSSRI